MAKKEFTGVNITLPTCRLAYPQVFEKKYNELKKKEEYSVTMLFDKASGALEQKGETTIKDVEGKKVCMTLKEAMILAAKNEFGTQVDLATLDLKRIKDGDAKDKAEFAGQWIVKASTTLKAPGVVFGYIDPATGDLKKVLEPDEIYSGVYANVQVTAKAYVGPKGNGVTLYLNHVQKVKDGEPMSGGPKVTDVFEELDIEEAAIGVAEGAGDDMEGMFS